MKNVTGNAVLIAVLTFLSNNIHVISTMNYIISLPIILLLFFIINNSK